MQPDPLPEPGTAPEPPRIYLEVPPGYVGMDGDERLAVAGGLAEAIQSGLGRA